MLLQSQNGPQPEWQQNQRELWIINFFKFNGEDNAAKNDTHTVTLFVYTTSVPARPVTVHTAHY